MQFDEVFCDPTVRRVGKPIAGRAIGTLVGTLFGCGATSKQCSTAEKIVSGAVGAGLGYALGAAWDAHCDR